MKFAALFPGQGSQHPGMGKFLFDEFKNVQLRFEECSDILKQDFKKLCFNGSEADLSLTENTQPALVLVSTCLYETIHQLTEATAQYSAGHSVGEYAALVSAKSISFNDALLAVRRRGQEMQKATPLGVGGMAAIMGLNPSQVVELCKWVEKETSDSPLEPANFNCPGQIVISGKQKLIQWLQENFKKEIFQEDVGRVKIIPLKVSAPFHCSLMKPAEDAMRPVLNDIHFSNAKFPVIQNYNALPVTEATVLRTNLIAQISAPVRWIESMEYLNHINLKNLIEFGAGKVLNGLVKKMNPDFIVHNINSIEELKALEIALTSSN